LGDLEQRRLELVGQAIGDIQGSIHANDNKSAAGLVVHGLLATGVLSLVGNLGPVYQERMGATAQDAVVALLALALACALLSIVFFCFAIRPYEPKQVNHRSLQSGYQGLFFPEIEGMTRAARRSGAPTELEQLRERLETVGEPERLETEYLGELAAVATIRLTEARWAKRGFNLLALEIVAVAAFLVVVGANAV
jgi:hypothetical protein